MSNEISAKEIALPFDIAGTESLNVDLDYVSKLLESNNLGYTGKGVKVAVLDTGYTKSSVHPMLEGKVILSVNFSSSPFIDDIVGHSTWCMSCIAGKHILTEGYNLHGIAPDAEIIAVKVLNDEGNGEFSSIIEGIHFAVENGANIISMSLGAPYDDNGESPLSQTVDWARSQGVIVCVAAGNSNTNGSPSPNTPGTSKRAITVGSINTKGAHSSFSSMGGASKSPYPTISAYGGDITNGDNNYDESIMGAFQTGYAGLRGTSMATPEIAGVCAILMEKLGNADLVEQALLKGAVDIDDPGIDRSTGYGKANAKKSIETTGLQMPSKNTIAGILALIGVGGALYLLNSKYHFIK